MHDLKVVLVFFSFEDLSGMPISTTMSLKAAVRSSVDGATRVFYPCLCAIWDICYRFDVKGAFASAENCGLTISAAWERVGPEMTTPF